MKRRQLPLALLAGMATLPQAAQAAAAGTLAPDIELPGSSAAARLSELRGKLVYLDFWASWCGPCRLSFPWMNQLHANHRQRGLLVLAVNVDARRADADAFLARHPAQFALAFDPAGESARRFAIKGMPSSTLIDRQGQVLFVHRGFRTDEAAALESRIVAALG